MNNELIVKFYGENYVNKIEDKIKLLGLSSKTNAQKFLSMRLFSSLIIFFVVLYISDFGYLLAPIISVLYYYLFLKLGIDSKIKKRGKDLEKEAIHFFEVLTLSLETGRNLEEAINVTVTSVESKLSREFKEAVRETEFGKSLTEALNDMQKNIPSNAINNIILTLIQADIYGNSIINNLYNQIDYLREKRKMEIKAEISKVPIKISIISVLFFIPLILLIIIGPVIITYIGG